MQIDLSSINKADFYVSERELDNLGSVYLVIPKKGKHSWSDNEMHLRSLLCLDDGTIVSSGFPKFLNYGEREDLDRITEREILSGNVFYTEKMDGSLIIRDVLVNGQVNFRTRGSHHLGDFKTPVMNLVKDKYPALLDPSLFPGESLLFEYTSPENRIILRYNEPSLTYLGSMDLTGQGLPRFKNGTPEKNKEIALALGAKSLEFHSMSDNPSEVISLVSSRKDSEGIVVWCHFNNQRAFHMSKIKAFEYRKLHSLRYNFSGNKMRMLCYAADITTEESLKDLLFKFGVDWETFDLFLPEFREFRQEVSDKRNDVDFLLEDVRRKGIDRLGSRKDMALALKDMQKDYSDKPWFFGMAMTYCLGDTDNLDRQIEAYCLNISPNALEDYKNKAASLYQSLLGYI